MGASRRLQVEIDRVLKKVQEGVELFDSIWNKVYDTDNANQKDKYETELKKEIKKLQRYRDQIKMWIQSTEIKDKKVSASYEQSLLDARKQIEREMERFKICEKETKIKAFSKEGLGQQAKTDPKEKAKTESRDWINNVVGTLESQLDIFEAEIEGLTVKKGKNRPPRLTHLETSITRHKAHIMKLELILRLLDNEELSAEQVNDIKDFLEDYVERNQDDFDEFSDVDELYETLPLDKVEALEDLVAVGQPSLVKAVVAPQQSIFPLEQLECVNSTDNNSNAVSNTPSKNILSSTSSATSPAGSVTNFIPVSASQLPVTHASTAASIPVCAQGIIESEGGYFLSSSLDETTLPAEVDSSNLLGQRAFPNFTGGGVVEGIEVPIVKGQPDNNPLKWEAAVPSQHLAIDARKSNVLGAVEKLSSGGMLQPTPTYSLNNWVPQSTSLADRTGSADSGYEGYPPFAAGRTFTSSIAPWILQSKPGFQNLNEMGQNRGRTEIAPDQREKFLQRLQQVQQQRPVNLLGMQTLGGSDNIEVTGQQHNPFLQQLNSQTSSMPFQVGLIPGLQAATSAFLEQPSTSIYSHAALEEALSNEPKDRDGTHVSAEEKNRQNLADDPRSVTGSFADVDFKASHGMGSSNLSRQPSRVGVIGERVIHDVGASDDNIGVSTSSTGDGDRDDIQDYKMLESALYKLPRPRDSELKRSCTPKCPAAAPPSYPQVKAPVLNDPKLWNRMASMHECYETLFFAFYYQQNTYQQYLAAKALMKQAWRYHRKHKTWFQRHGEPIEATDDYERGSYVYFDFNLAGDDHDNGWCPRMKQDFTFEYAFLEDQLRV